MNQVNPHMPDGKNVYDVALEMTSFIEIFTSHKKHKLNRKVSHRKQFEKHSAYYLQQ